MSQIREGAWWGSEDESDSGEVFGDGDAGERDGAEEEITGLVVDADLEAVDRGVSPVEVGDERSEAVDTLAEGDDGGLFESNR